jgi:hypothetical protein
MKSKSPYTIVNRPSEMSEPRDKVTSSLTSALKRQSKSLAASMDRIPPALIEALASTAKTPAPKRLAPARAKTVKGSSRQAAPAVPASLLKLAERAAAAATASTVGILDLGAWVSRLPHLLEVMNKAQDRLVFLELQTPVPAGLIKTTEPLTHWAAEHLGRPLTAAESEELNRNMLADEFYYFAESVRVQNKLDVLVGLTPAMIAFVEDGLPYWNYFATGQDQVSLISTCDLRDFSAQAGRPYEAAVGMLVAAQVLALRNDLTYHPETRGCVFDFNEARTDLVTSIKAMRIEPDCLSHIHEAAEAKAARSLVAALARMKEARHG